MKLYRAVPITMFSSTPHSEAHPEDIYISNGFITVNHKHANDFGEKNDLGCQINGNGKYFYFFPEHAIVFGSDIYHNEYLLKLIEYELPDDIAFKIIGSGYYRVGSATRSIPETLINYQDIPGTWIASSAITPEEKLKMLKLSLMETYNRILTIEEYENYHNMDYNQFFETLCQEDSNPFMGNGFLDQYLNDYSDLIYVGYINRWWTINNDVTNNTIYFNKNALFEENIEYLRRNGLNLQLTEESEYARIDFNVNGIMNDNAEKAKVLLNNYHTNFPN